MKVPFAGVRTVKDAIRYLDRIQNKWGEETEFSFGDGSPVSLVVTDEVEDSADKLKIPVVQVRLDKIVK